MALVPSILGGSYGDGTFGFKCSRPNYDVTVLADDNDITKRSYNSQWTNLVKIKILGAGLADWRQYQSHGDPTPFSGQWVSATSGIRRDQSYITVETGLDYIPVWEARLFDPVSDIFFDDYCDMVFPGGTFVTTAGGRARFPGPTSSLPANTLTLSPWENYTSNYTDFSTISHNIYNQISYQPIGTYPPFPTPPNQIAMAYVIYKNKIGDVA